MDKETESIIELYWNTKSHHHYFLTMGLYEAAAILEATLSTRIYASIFSEL